MQHFRHLLFAALLAPALCAAPSAQDDTTVTSRRGDRAAVELTQAEVALTHYKPSGNASHVLRAADRLYGREIVVQGLGDGRPVDNLFTVGDSIVIYDTPQYAELVVQALRRLEGTDAEAPARPVYEAREYVPRHVSLRTAYEALDTFRRTLLVTSESGTSQVRNVSPIDERSMLILRDTPSNLAEMTALLGRVDVPEQQVLLTCQLVYPAGHGSDPERGADETSKPLPTDLVANLSKLTGIEGFRRASSAMVRTAVRSDRPIRMELDGFLLELTPVAFDREAGAMKLSSCNFLEKRTKPDLETDTEVVFSTSTSVRAGQWTVLGASGDSPYVVLRIALLE